MLAIWQSPHRDDTPRIKCVTILNDELKFVFNFPIQLNHLTYLKPTDAYRYSYKKINNILYEMEPPSNFAE